MVCFPYTTSSDLAVQETLKSLLQHHSSKASILWHSAFFILQLSHPYMTTGKTIALTRWTFVGKVISLLLNMLSRLVITFLPRSKRFLISWLQSASAVILEPQKIKADTVSTVFPSIFHEGAGFGQNRWMMQQSLLCRKWPGGDFCRPQSGEVWHSPSPCEAHFPSGFWQSRP